MFCRPILLKNISILSVHIADLISHFLRQTKLRKLLFLKLWPFYDKVLKCKQAISTSCMEVNVIYVIVYVNVM